MIKIQGESYQTIKITSTGCVTPFPGELAGAKLLTDLRGGSLKLYDGNSSEPLLELLCPTGNQEREEILPEVKRHQGGLFAILEGGGAEALVYDLPLDSTRALQRILEVLEKEFAPQWVHSYKFNLDTAETNHLLDDFPSGPKFIYVKECDGTVTLRFDSQNEPSWTLPTDMGLYLMPFEKLYLTWTAQAGKKLVFYVSNREIKWTTLA